MYVCMYVSLNFTWQITSMNYIALFFFQTKSKDVCVLSIRISFQRNVCVSYVCLLRHFKFRQEVWWNTSHIQVYESCDSQSENSGSLRSTSVNMRTKKHNGRKDGRADMSILFLSILLLTRKQKLEDWYFRSCWCAVFNTRCVQTGREICRPGVCCLCAGCCQSWTSRCASALLCKLCPTFLLLQSKHTAGVW